MDDESEDVKPELNPVERFEKAFQSCLAVITKEDNLTNLDHDEIRVDAEFAIRELMDRARSVEAYFLKKRLHIAHLKPELILKDDTNELRLELLRKDELLKRNSEKIAQWQNMLADVQATNVISFGGFKSGTIMGTPGNVPPSGPGTMNLGGPLTPGGSTSRSQTPVIASRPQTPMSAGPMTPQGRNYQGMSQQQQQQQPLGPLACLEKTASTIGMNMNP